MTRSLRRLIVMTALLAGWSTQALAASFRASLDREAVAPGEPFLYQVILTAGNEEVADYRPPEFKGLQVLQTPRFPSRSTNMQIKANRDRRIWTIARINLLRISCNKLGMQPVSPITLSITLPPLPI